MGFCNCINKTFLIILNFIVLAVGAGVIALASVVIHRSSEYKELLLEGVFTLPIWILLIGIVVALIGFFGCCGALKGHSCMLYTYATIVLVLFIAEVTLGILIAVYPKQAAAHIKTNMSNSFEKYGEDDTALSRAIDSIQHDAKCCGVNDYRDWYTFHHGSIPESCCEDPANCNTEGGSRLIAPSGIFEKGCFDAIVDDLKGVTVALGVSAVVLAVIQVVCIIIACGLARKKMQYV